MEKLIESFTTPTSLSFATAIVSLVFAVIFGVGILIEGMSKPKSWGNIFLGTMISFMAIISMYNYDQLYWKHYKLLVEAKTKQQTKPSVTIPPPAKPKIKLVSKLEKAKIPDFANAKKLGYPRLAVPENYSIVEKNGGFYIRFPDGDLNDDYDPYCRYSTPEDAQEAIYRWCERFFNDSH